MTPEDALKAFGFLALLEELDKEEFEYDEEGRLTSVPTEFTVEYLVAIAGYDGDEWGDYSEKVYGPPNLSDDEVIQLAGGDPESSGLYIGKGDEQGYSVAETPIRKKDIPKGSRVVKSD